MAKFIPKDQRRFELNLPHEDRWDFMNRLIQKYPESSVPESLKLMVADPEFSAEFIMKSHIRESNNTPQEVRTRMQLRQVLKGLEKQLQEQYKGAKQFD